MFRTGSRGSRIYFGVGVVHSSFEATTRKLTRPVHLLKSGFSCKSFSRMNANFIHNMSAMERNELSNSSVRTFCATMDVVAMVKPPVFVFENVDSIVDKSEGQRTSNLDLVTQAIEQGWSLLHCHSLQVVRHRPRTTISSSSTHILSLRVQGVQWG